jgi:hypothetical protein
MGKKYSIPGHYDHRVMPKAEEADGRHDTTKILERDKARL